MARNHPWQSCRLGIDSSIIRPRLAFQKVTGDAPYEKKWAQTAFTAWVRDAKYQRFDPVPIKPLLVHLSFIPNPRYWGMAFRRGQFEIAAQDFALIEQTAGTQ
jgi:hypothetical protein